ncbi:oxidoreductase domain protein [Haloterrigena turkmenica DSM 5511]|uniref:Oxidoreductase domain protein n=1 Tax=Haloterrigena turkmenica (strain ATCC 51198 / DSM 5511 / JCM 9101 / NCIMB 13204 / VKM B-1734 / 4k) TaxID=543526 RepID=D2RU10_HALTV|nr:Gfo/Idh/MocA family oxidoreductase [Haloterrigena turkmenica]ADB59079.1 oxidoreductase domain protein [Haloterrigena turkmenica DSM 5511]
MDFGVLSTAGIARKAFLPALEATDHEATAVASRDGERARTFADDHGIDESYEGYDDLIADANIDAVYIPLPNGLHAQWTKRAADAGLDVLCEKPLTVDAGEAREVVEHCEDRGVTLMEGFMYLYHPRTERAIELAQDKLEDVRSVTAAFKFPLFDRPDDVRLSPDLDGGSLMDVGCYPVSLVRQILGEPERAYAHADDSRGAGVDTELAGILEYDDGSSARVASGFDTQKVQRYRVEAENGWLEVRDAFDAPTDEPLELEYRIDGRHAVETFDAIDQYSLEIEEFASSVENDRPPRTDGEEAIANMRVIDALAESAERDRPIEV